MYVASMNSSPGSELARRINKLGGGWACRMKWPNTALPDAQKKMAGGTGDDAGHLIGNRFGAPGGRENLSPQNWKANRFGTYKDLENLWARKRLTNIEVF